MNWYRADHDRPSLAGVMLTLGLLAACTDSGSGTTPASMTASPPARRPVVVDTDLAVDDLIALALLLSSSEVDVTAVTVSGTGEVRCPAGLDVTRGLLALMGREDVPVACGRTTPLAGERAFPDEWRDAADDGWGLGLPVVSSPATDQTAVELLTTALEPGGMTVLTLGPATNLADAFRVRPSLVAGVSSIVMMGGAVDVPGNVFLEGSAPLAAEWNFYVDPVAAAEVVGAGAPVTMVGLDATSQVPVSGDLVELLRLNSGTEVARFVHGALMNNPTVYSGGAYFWDPLAAGVVIDPTLVTTESTPIEVTTEDGVDIGRTVRGDDGQPVDVALGADVPGFEQLLVRALSGIAPGAPLTAIPPPTAEAAVRFSAGECTITGPATVAPGRMRFTFATDEVGWFGAVTPTTSELTDQQITDLVATKGSDAAAELGVTSPTLLFAVGGTYLTVAETRQIVLCGDDAGAVLVAGILLVKP